MVQVAGREQRGERGPDDELKLQSKAILQFALDLGLKGSRPRPPDTTVEKRSARADLSIATLLTLFLLARMSPLLELLRHFQAPSCGRRRKADTNSSERGHFDDFVVTVSAMARAGVRNRRCRRRGRSEARKGVHRRQWGRRLQGPETWAVRSRETGGCRSSRDRVHGPGGVVRSRVRKRNPYPFIHSHHR